MGVISGIPRTLDTTADLGMLLAKYFLKVENEARKLDQFGSDPTKACSSS